jgi:hypothetical protein
MTMYSPTPGNPNTSMMPRWRTATDERASGSSPRSTPRSGRRISIDTRRPISGCTAS